jgi:hypothetical protein
MSPKLITQAGGAKRKSKKVSKKASKKVSKKPSKKVSKKASSKKSSRKLSRDMSPIMVGFITLKSHIGNELKKIGGNAGPIAAIVTKLYINKVATSKKYEDMTNDEKLELFKKIKSVFDSDSEATRKKMLSDAQSIPRKAKKTKSSD